MDLCVIDERLLDEREWFGRDRDTWHEEYPPLHPEAPRFATRSLSLLIAHAVDDADDLASTFESLRKSWHREYGASSSLTAIARCGSYQQIIALGKAVLPLIFEDLKRQPEPDHWFEALRRITDDDPVPPSDRGNRRRVAKAWLKWGRDHGYA